MDAVEDSGFDSDPKPRIDAEDNTKVDVNILVHAAQVHVDSNITANKVQRKASDLQKRIERQRLAGKRTHNGITQQPKRSFLIRNRLFIPGSKPSDRYSANQDAQPLVAIVSDDSSDDEFGIPALSKEAQREITQQLIKDGYNLDLEPDDEDLDLMVPRPLNERLSCCQPGKSTCTIQ